jgi:hypothetical protein
MKGIKSGILGNAGLFLWRVEILRELHHKNQAQTQPFTRPLITKAIIPKNTLGFNTNLHIPLISELSRNTLIVQITGCIVLTWKSSLTGCTVPSSSVSGLMVVGESRSGAATIIVFPKPVDLTFITQKPPHLYFLSTRRPG